VALIGGLASLAAVSASIRTAARPASPPVDPEARAACAAAAAPWRALPGTTVRTTDTTLATGDVLADLDVDTQPPPGAPGGRWAACVVEGLAPAGLDSTGRAALYWPAPGWGVLVRLVADGPDGQVQVYQRGWVRCQVGWEWDGGDDTDSTYVPDPFFRERTLCWRHGRLLAPADTMPLAP
jgi:hypothetical protein